MIAAASPEDFDRKSQREIMAAKRAAQRDLQIPPPADPARRRERLASVYHFLRGYFPTVFYQPFTDSRMEMVDAIVKAAAESGDQAIAGPRGDGKTRCALFTALWLCLSGKCHFPLIISKSGKMAERELGNLKWAIRESVEFAADFPEVAAPILALGGWASRARQQTAFGQPTELEWGVEKIILPTITTDALRERVKGWPADIESAARGQIFASLGIEGPVRGYNVRNRRPDLAIIDDVDDRESAHSELQTGSRIDIIDADVGGLGGPDRVVSRVMLCTLINRSCAAWVFTDRTQRPSFRGQRHKLIAKMPDNVKDWDTYVSMRQSRNIDADPDAREAHRYYIERREAMDAGHVTTNPYRFNQGVLGDGQPAEVSSLQAYYNFVADKGLAAALTELQNDPPPDENAGSLILTAYHVRVNARSGLARGVVPDDCVGITCGGDVKKLGLHHVTVAWNAAGAGTVIDYDFFEFAGTQGQKAAACELLILEGLLAWWEARQRENWRQADGTEWTDDYVLVDAGWKDEGWNAQPVVAFANRIKGIIPIKGMAPYYQPKPSRQILIGDNWYYPGKSGSEFLELNADHWKIKVHEGFLLASGEPGSLGLWQPPKDDYGRERINEHNSYSHHITAESWRPKPGGGFSSEKWGWHHEGKRKPNHWFDATAYACCARSLLGINLTAPRKQQQQKPSGGSGGGGGGMQSQPARPRPKQPSSGGGSAFALPSGKSWIG